MPFKGRITSNDGRHGQHAQTVSSMQKGRKEKGTFPVTDAEKGATCIANAQKDLQHFVFQ